MKSVSYNGPARLAKRRNLYCAAGPSLYLRWTLLLSFMVVCRANPARGQPATVINLGDPAIRQELVGRLLEHSRQRKADALNISRYDRWPARRRVGNTILELMAIEDGRVCVYKTFNANSAISIAADLVRNTPPYDVNGYGLTVGQWDAGVPRTTHQELVGRITPMESATTEDHATHVAGTIAATGVQVAARGMAPRVVINSYEWNNDLAEATSRAMSYPGEPGAIQISNHSYGTACGWDYGYSPPRWYGTWGDRESDLFGMYDSDASQWDELAYGAPYYLPFRSAGNDRNDDAPLPGVEFEYYDPPPFWDPWKTKAYDPDTDPYADGWDNGGFDTINPQACAKNVLTVGAVEDAVTSGLRDLNKATMTTFSTWGPTDDGRIKPDVVTNGTTLYSSIAASDTSYAYYSGTSMSSPSAAGAAALLVDYYGRLFPGQAMRASTIKALIVHTADDLGNPGPDYKFGWGLMNTKGAAAQIADQFNYPEANKIVEATLSTVNSIDTYTFERDSTGPIRATVCWTDPPASALSNLDNPSPRLVNDLDIRIIDPNGLTHYPYVLDRANPGVPAAAGDNSRDNVEQVVIQSPSVPGDYAVTVTYKGTLTNGIQYYSLILTGQRTRPHIPGDLNDDGLVNLEDVATLSLYWLSGEPTVDIAPAGGDGIVNFLDFAAFAANWN